MGENQIISDMITALETSNVLLNSYHKETEPGLKKDTIQKMIETNCLGISNALDYCGQQSQLEEADGEFIGRFVGIPVENYDEILSLLSMAESIACDSEHTTTLGLLNNIRANLKIEGDCNGK